MELVLLHLMKPVCKLYTIAADSQSISNLVYLTWVKVHYIASTDNGHPERAFFQKFETFGLGQTNWAEILGGILAISSQTIGTILAL